MDLRRSHRTAPWGQRIWLGPPHERWVSVENVSRHGLRVVAGGLRAGATLVVRRDLAVGPGEARIAAVVYSDAHGAGLHYLPDRPSDLCTAHDRRRAVRIATRGLTVWITEPLQTPAIVRDISATGARIEPLVPMKRNLMLRAELLFGDIVLCERRARVVRVCGDEVGLRFVDLANRR